MSVKTSADEHRDKAKDHIQKAINELQNCVNDDWGWSNYREDYQNNVLEITTELIKLKRKL